MDELKPWAVQPVDYIGLMKQLENYERRESSRTALAVAMEYQQLKWAESPRAELAEYIDQHYRNANIRIAISDDLINRLIPQGHVIQEKVDDVISGARVSGRSRTVNGLRVFLMPDRRRWRMGLEARGRVASETQSRHGPALFFNEGISRYRAEKLVVVDRLGVKVGQTQVRADSSTDLTGLETEFDPLPLIGMLARAVAQNQHDSQIAEVRSQAESKVETKVRRRMDKEVEGKLREAEDQFQQKLVLPLQQLKLDPTITDLRTTGERLIARYRLAGYHQLAAHTARPQAPSDSLLSAQIHQTAINNLLDNLDLNDRRTDLAQLMRELSETFQANDILKEDDLPEGVTVHFAKENAVRVEFKEDRVTVTMRLIELSSGRNRWRYFIVRGHYKPDSTRLDAQLARDGHIELAGKRLSFRDQIALRAIFCKVMDKNRTFALIGKQLTENPKTSDLKLTQCRVRDGWLGLAVGPKNRPTSHPDVEMAKRAPNARPTRVK